MTRGGKPVVFISSTCYDLSQVRIDLRDFLSNNYGFEPMLSEFDTFPVAPCKGTFENCLYNVDNCADILVLIVGHRYGHIMENGKSITNLEYLHAKAKKIPIFVFVTKKVYDTLSVWRANKEGDFSSVVEDTRVFQFLADIYDEEHQWVYPFESAQDITRTLKHQFSLFFADGLKWQQATKDTRVGQLIGQLSPNAIRTMIEQPFAWEYKFLAYTLQSEFESLKTSKWDLTYAFSDAEVVSLTQQELLAAISRKVHEALNIVNMIDRLINKTMPDAIGQPGVPSDLELMIYCAKRFSYLYKLLVSWSLYFKTLQVDDAFENLLSLLSDMPKSALNEIEEFVENFCKQIIALPDVDDGCDHSIQVTCALSIANTKEIDDEILALHQKLSSEM